MRISSNLNPQPYPEILKQVLKRMTYRTPTHMIRLINLYYVNCQRHLIHMRMCFLYNSPVKQPPEIIVPDISARCFVYKSRLPGIV